MTTDKLNRNETKALVNVAMGRASADLVILGGQWVCVQTGEIIPNTDIAVTRKRIAYVGANVGHTIGQSTKIINAQGQYLVPGLLDGHVHVESSMLTVSEFVRAVLPHGTTGIFADPHEIGNVYGLKGVRLMVDEASVQPIHVWMQVPSCVPSAPGFETPGAVIGPQEVAEAITWDGVIGLGEVMNYPAVQNNDADIHEKIAITRQAGKIVGGHYPSPDLGMPFYGYAAGGAQDDHEGTRLEDAKARLRMGMRAMFRLGSAWHDLDAQVPVITRLGLDARHAILCTDDCHSATLVNEGHVNRVVKRAINQGVSPMVAIQMTTLNTAEHFRVSDDVGLIAPGRFADILLVNDLHDFQIEKVIAKGQLVVESGKLLIEQSAFAYPSWVQASVRLKRTSIPDDFKLSTMLSSPGKKTIIANVIGVIENQAPTRHLRMKVGLNKGEVQLDHPGNPGLAKVALVERHIGRGSVQVGLVHGFGLNVPCAIGSTVAHDCHQLIIMGTNEVDMALAANELSQSGGGQIVIQNGDVLGRVNLPIAGLMSKEPAQTVVNQLESVLRGFSACGCKLNNPNMLLSLLALVVIPELRISDLGLVNVEKFTFIPVLEE